MTNKQKTVATLVKEVLAIPSEWLEKYVLEYQRLLRELNGFNLPQRVTALKQQGQNLRCLFALSALGAEPGLPPEGWTMGLFQRERDDFDSTMAHALAQMSWTREGRGQSYAYRVFVGQVPRDVYEKYKAVRGIMPNGRIVVAAPNPSFFSAPLTLADPMLFTYIDGIGWLRICAWNVEEDMKAMKE